MNDKEELILKPSLNSICGKSYNLLNIKLLNSCNGKCSFCIAAGTPYKKSSEAIDFIKTAISMKDFSKVDVLGGEPTLYPDLVKVFKGIRPHKKEIGIISNGSNLKVINECLPYLDTVTLSIHSFNYSKNSTGIIIDEKELKKLNKNKGRVETISTVVITKKTVSNLKEIKEYAKKAKKLGFSAIKLMELITSNENIDFIDLQDLLISFNIHQKNATLKGCFFELPELSKYLKIKTHIKLCCPFNNVFKAKNFGIPKIEYQHDYMNVIQPDCSITDTWVYDSFNNKMGRMGPRLCIQTTTACNGKCFFCVGRHNIPCKVNIDEIIKNAILLDNYPDVLLLGGESTLFPEDLIKIINEIAPYKRKITVNTNGYNLECLLPVAEKLDKLIVSVMGNDEINNNIIGVKPQLYTIKEFHKKNPKLKLRVNCVVNKKGIDSFDQMTEFILEMKKIGFNSIKFSEMSTDDFNDPNFVDLQKMLEPYCNDIHQNDTLQEGCYLEPKSLEERFGVKIILNLTCNLKTPIKQPQYQSLRYETMCFDSVYISPDGSIHERIVATSDLANERGAC